MSAIPAPEGKLNLSLQMLSLKMILKNYTGDSDIFMHYFSQQGWIYAEQGEKQQVKGKRVEDAPKMALW